ncbi:protein JINGUBANG-like [Cynara cardunculus var. scolymus]|uniref:protein JINGUBANG-like n=1 Tax=Cynara cardunculus var. scolymus TaxID=59895 RepID=UPI000D630437|nr:protein JINGUBANG-like [Cynara cardunculus var. scolymus]
MNSLISSELLAIPLLSIKITGSASNSSDAGSNDDEIPAPAAPQPFVHYGIPKTPSSFAYHHPLSTVTGHTESVSCLALCGEFILSASHAKEIMVWQQPDLRLFTKFGHGRGSVKAIVTVGSKIFTAHQDSKIRVWKVSRSLENIFKLVETLPTTKDYLGKFMNHTNYIQTRRHHRRLWIEHTDTISCLSIHNDLIYSGSWDRTIKIWRLSDYKCLESIKAHDDAINALTTSKGTVLSASADGKIKAWERRQRRPEGSHVLKFILEGHKDISVNSVVVSGDGTVVYGCGSDGYVMGWSSDDNWKKVFEVQAHKMAVLCMCMKGEILCTGSTDHSIGVWKKEVKGLTKIGVMLGHEGPIKCLQVSPSSIGGGFLVYSGSLDKSIRVWWVPQYSGRTKVEDFNSPVKITKAITTPILF